MDKILVFLGNHRDFKLIEEVLGQSYQILPGENASSLSQSFDLCLFDMRALRAMETSFEARRLQEAPLSLPFVLLGTDRETAQFSEHIWQKVDDLIAIPIRKLELSARIEASLRIRRQSVEIERLKQCQINELESRLSLAVEAAGIGLWEWDLKTNRVYYSKEWKSQIGYADHEIGHDYSEWESRVHPQDRSIPFSTIDDVISQKIFHYDIEYRLRHKDGSYRWLISRGSSILDEMGEVVKIFGAHVDITDRKAIEEELAASEERFRTLFETANDAIMIAENATIVDCNTKAIEIFGCDRKEDLVGQTAIDLSPEKQPDGNLSEALVHGYVQSALNMNPHSFQWRHCRIDGSPFDSEVSLNATRIKDQKYLQVVVRDITDRIQAEKLLRESEERFRTIFDFIPDAICLNRLDDLTFVGVNRTFFPSSGYTEEEVIGKTPEDLNMFYDLKDLSEVLDGLESEGQISNLEIKLRAANGSLVIALISSVLINIGEVTHVLTIAKDISELKYAHEERLRLATAVEQASEGVAITDVEGHIVYVNPAFIEMTGYSSDELVEQNPRILKSGQHDDEFYRDLWKTITSGQVWKGRLINKAKNGTLFYEDATISPLKDSTGKIVNFVAVKRDVTENVELSRQLAHSQKMEAIGTLAGGIAHDFNNILFAMLGYTEMAQGEVSPESTAGRHLKHVMDSGKRATDMVRQILYFSHQSQPEWGPIAIGSIVKEGLKFLRSSIPTTIEIRQNIEKDLPNIIGDPTQIHQILMNFCTNAAHAMKDKIGVITVEVSEAVSKTDFTKLHPPLLPGKFVKLVVSDTGHGIPTEIIDQIFDPYFTTKPIGEGTGLGLSIVHGIIKSHGGALAVESQPGKGTSFIVFLPTIEEIRQTEENKQQKNLPRGTEHILVVDDEEMIKSLIEEMLTSLGYRVTSTTSAVEALEIYRSKPDQFSLVMTDFTMPLMTGVDLAREMLAIKQDIPILMCTGFSHVIEDGDLERWGIRSIIRKPILLFEIAKTVREVLDKS